MPGYPIGIGKEDYKILEREAKREGCSTKDLIRGAFNRKIGSLRGGVGRRRRR